MRITAKIVSGRGTALACLWWLCVVLLQPLTLLGADEEPMQALLRQLATQGRLEIAGATVYDLRVTQQYYQRSDWAPAWTRPESIAELAAAIEQAWREGMSGQDYHQQQVQGLLDGSLDLDVPSRDLLLTDSLVRLTYHYALGKVDPRDYVASWNFDRELPQTDPVAWMGQVIAAGGIGAGLDRLKPSTATYKNMVEALARYRALAAAGGWGGVDEGPTLRVGDSGPRVAQLRLRLQAEGDLAAAAATGVDPRVFDPGLEQAIVRFQRRHRLDADGVVGKQTVAAMNVPIERRVGQLRVNLERARVLRDIPDTAVVVDIAGFEVSMFRDGQRLFTGRAQVGRPYRSTPVFSDTITYIEFNPTWTVPPTIFRKDVLPAIKRDPAYLEKRDMQVLTMDGREVDPASIDWDLYPRQGFPYMIRQRPGPANALGRLKIMFPNEHMVYLHDTPSRELFRRSERTFSSGCIRVENAEQLAALVLDDPEQWSLPAVNAAIAAKETRRVSLREPVPVYLVYWTVQVREDGEVEFKRDPYDRDALILDLLDKPLVPDAGRLERAVQGS
ncbi:MAG: L,D-transpeptidase family protein [Halieaceae bacterium]|nr:L,D-transpeptidase family protein [Halieaceae bacterium]